MEYLAASMRTNRKLDKIEDEKKKNKQLFEAIIEELELDGPRL